MSVERQYKGVMSVLSIIATLAVASCGDGSSDGAEVQRDMSPNSVISLQGKSADFGEIFRQEELVRLSETKEVLTVSPEIALDSDVIWVADP
ncbi:MAG: hypothetical protein LBG44_10920, partial [Gemmatimonadota bacterium]|nr:hypothetical protein [Gemmatimonadota bacterium]